MIIFAMIVRTDDGLPLSASTDVCGQMDKDIKEVRMQIKLVSRHISRLEDRCTINLNPHLIHIISSLGISFMALCESTYPPVLAFSFLDELMREFITTYDTSSLNSIIRPYAFIEFDSFIHKTRLKYNSPRSLTTRIDLSNLSTEIKLRPPQQLNLFNLLPQNKINPIVSFQDNPLYLSSLPWYIILTVAFTLPCTLISFYRGITGLSESSIEEVDGINPSHSMSFLIEAFAGCLQIYLTIYKMQRKKLVSLIILVVVIICNIYLWEIKDLWQSLMSVIVSSINTIYILKQQSQVKKPNYNV
ncbi:vesicle-trafficking protein SEC22a-like [Centruroides vittatus]|uniref:vesicle-trafficking protein SEC22a-like n=1 Tax=Centruroides vittatus TaxID=120091 RepID=UPI0035106127